MMNSVVKDKGRGILQGTIAAFSER